MNCAVRSPGPPPTSGIRNRRASGCSSATTGQDTITADSPRVPPLRPPRHWRWASAWAWAGVFGSVPAHGTGTIQTAAFTLVEHSNGTATLTINPKVLFEPTVLQRDLQEDGIPAIVTIGSFCSSDPAPVSFGQVVTFDTSPSGITINPAAMPAGTELSVGDFQLAQGHLQTEVGLITTNSHTCTSNSTAALTRGGGLVVGFAESPAKAGA